jgi:hypothetical protein
MFVSACGGAFLGAILSLVVNCALVEVTLNPFFALYMGIILLAVGCGVIARVVTHTKKSPRGKLIVFLGLLVVISGMLCILFQRRWMFTLTEAQRVPLYTLLGMSVAFAVAFAMVDLVNMVTSEVWFLCRCFSCDTIVQTLRMLGLYIAH